MITRCAVHIIVALSFSFVKYLSIISYMSIKAIKLLFLCYTARDEKGKSPRTQGNTVLQICTR